MFSCQRSHLLLALLLTTALTMAVGSFAKPNGNGPTAPTSAVVTPIHPHAFGDLQVVASGGSDAAGATVTYQYQWQVLTDAPLATWTDLAGETSSTLSHPLHRDWQYQVLVWSVSGFPAVLSATSLTSNAVTVLNSAPSIPAALDISPAQPFVSDDLLATYAPSTDVDGDTLSYTVQWALSTDGGFTWGAWGNDGLTLTAGSFVRGQTWRARVIASDGTLSSIERVSASVVIGNSLPTTNDTPTILPANPTSSTDLSVSALSGTDADGDEVTFRYQWARRNMNGVKAKGPAWGEWEDGGDTLPYTRLIRGDQ